MYVAYSIQMAVFGSESKRIQATGPSGRIARETQKLKAELLGGERALPLRNPIENAAI